MSSACPRSLTIIKRLLDVPDVEVNCKSRDGLFALKYAASSDDEELLELLLSHPGVDVNNTDNYQNTALMMAGLLQEKFQNYQEATGCSRY